MKDQCITFLSFDNFFVLLVYLQIPAESSRFICLCRSQGRPRFCGRPSLRERTQYETCVTSEAHGAGARICPRERPYGLHSIGFRANPLCVSHLRFLRAFHKNYHSTIPLLLLFNDFKTAVILRPPLKNKLHENQNLGNNVGGQLCLILPSDLPKSRITDVASASPCFARKPRS